MSSAVGIKHDNGGDINNSLFQLSKLDCHAHIQAIRNELGDKDFKDLT